jgi:hypothetical protein
MLENRKLKMGVLLIALLMVTLGVYVIWANVGLNSTGLAESKQEFSLVHPAFAQSVTAATTFLDQEAGISIYLNTGSSVSINAVSPILTSIENQTSDWIIGSVPLGGFSSSEYPHCFVSKSGWFVVYYLRATPQNMAYASKMITWAFPADVNSPLNQSKLLQALIIVCTPLGIPTTNSKYYDFQYPSATNLLIVAKTTISGSPATFNIKIPGSATVYEQSWSHKNYHTGYGDSFKIDQTLIDSPPVTGVTVGMIAFLPTNYLAPDMFHVVYVDGYYGTTSYYCGICLTILYT